MRPAILLLLVPLLLPAVCRAEDDPRTMAYKMFFKERVAPNWVGLKPSEQRVLVVRSFDKHDVPEAARWLMTEVLLKDDAADVKRAAIQVLTKYKNPEALAEMASVWEKKFKKPPESRALGLYAFAGSTKDEVRKPIALGLKDKDPRVVQAACRTAGIAGRLEFVPDLVKLLGHKSWACRSGAALALAELSAFEAMPQIFTVFCRDDSHRVRYDCWLALKKLSRNRILPCRPAAWEEWWTNQQQEAAKELAEGEKNPWGDSFPHLNTKIAEPAHFFRMPILADRICIVIDASQSMTERWTVDHKAERDKPKEERIPGFFNVKTRWGLMRNYLKVFLKELPETTQVGLVFYHHDIIPYPENGKLFKNNAKARDKALNWIEEEVKQKATTSIYDGLDKGWGFVRDGHPDHNFRKGCETIVFLTDGKPTDGRFIKRPDRIRDEAWRVTMVRGMRYFVVGIHRHSYELLKEMAKTSRGLYVHAQEPGVVDEPQDLEFWPEKEKAFRKAQKEAKRRKKG
jgi:hypothetical protein